jgi:hypothetical protein
MSTHHRGALAIREGGFYKGLMGSFSHAVKGTFEYMDMSRTATANGAGFLVVAICSLILIDFTYRNNSVFIGVESVCPLKRKSHKQKFAHGSLPF